MPIQIEEIIFEEAYGATASFFSEKLEIDIAVNAIALTMKFNQAGAVLCTLAEVLTQMATTISVKVKGKEIFNMSATDLFKLNQFLAKSPTCLVMSDGTGADNHIMSATLIIPLGLEIELNELNGDYGLDPRKQTVIVGVDFPADGNKVDVRKLTISAIGVHGASPTKLVKRSTTNKTPTAANDAQIIDLPYGDGEVLADIFVFQTTGLSAGTTTDTKTLEKIAVQLSTTDVYLVDVNSELFDYFNRNLSQTATSPTIPDTYLYMPLGHGKDKYDGIPLDKAARIRFEAGDTNALRFMHGVIIKHPS